MGEREWGKVTGERYITVEELKMQENLCSFISGA